VSVPRSRTDRDEVDLDEDLFDFASVTRSSDGFPPEHGPALEEDEEDLDRVMASIRDTQAAQEAARAATAVRATSSRAMAAARTRPEASPARTGTQRGSPQAQQAPPLSAPRRRSSSLAVVAIAVTVLNSALAVVVLRPTPSKTAPDLTGPEFAAATPPLGPASVAPNAPTASVAAAAPVVTAHPSLDEAWEAVARGEYAAARQRAYALLALLDGVESDERAALESDCRYLIAQALYLDALARRKEAP
jgi:hypothetical protein